MPKTAVNEDDLPERAEYHVRMTGQILRVEPIPVSEGEGKLADEQLGP